jgi:hypothetical protein
MNAFNRLVAGYVYDPFNLLVVFFGDFVIELIEFNPYNCLTFGIQRLLIKNNNKTLIIYLFCDYFIKD